jgi:hypothetical protein
MELAPAYSPPQKLITFYLMKMETQLPKHYDLFAKIR